MDLTSSGKGFLRRNEECCQPSLSFPTSIQFYSALILDPLMLGHRVIGAASNGVGGAPSIIFEFELRCPRVHTDGYQ